MAPITTERLTADAPVRIVGTAPRPPPCQRTIPSMSTLITNALVLTLDRAMTVHEPGWVLIEGDAIGAIGAGVSPEIAGAERLDVGGDLIMPGMVNPHCHMAMTLFRGLGEDVDDRLFRYIL